MLMPGWFNRRPSGPGVAASRLSGCTTVARSAVGVATRSATVASRPAAIEALEPRVVMSASLATVSAPPVSAAAEATFPLGGNLQFQTETTRDHALSDLVKATTGFQKLSG